MSWPAGMWDGDLGLGLGDALGLGELKSWLGFSGLLPGGFRVCVTAALEPVRAVAVRLKLRQS